MNSEFVKEVTTLKREVDGWYEKYSNAYNSELAKKLYTMLNKLKDLRTKLEKEYNNAPVGSKEEKELFELGNLIADYHKYFLGYYNSMQKLKPAYPAMNTGAVYGTSSSAVSEPKEKNGHGAIATIALITAAAALFISLFPNVKPINTWFNGDDKKVEQIADKEETDQKADKEVKDQTNAGEFTDATDNKQVMKRAEEIYVNYCIPYLEKMTEYDRSQAVNICNVENIANIIRFRNGVLPLNEDGEPYYNSNTIDDIASNQASIFAEYPSLEYFEKDIFFVPSYLTLIDGSIGQKTLKQIDDKMEKVVIARRSGNYEAFVEAAKIWAYEYVEQFIKKDFTGQNGIFSVEGPGRYNYFIDVDEKYITVIFEVTQGNNSSICIKLCTEDGVWKEYSLSQIVDMARNGKDDYLSSAAGTHDSYKESATPLFKQCYQRDYDYFQDIVDRYYADKGFSLDLK